MIKIGLLAPFEGLYRRTGYEALAAMRLAIAETPVAGIDLLPLALDDSQNPQRTLQKLLADASVRAIVGPQNPTSLARLSSWPNEDRLSWFIPFAIEPETGVFANSHQTTAWATQLVEAVAEGIQPQQRLVLAGLEHGWPQQSSQTWTEIAGLPVLVNDNPTVVQPTDAILWLGNPAEGAVYLARVRQTQPDVPFWMGPEGGDPVFAERAPIRGPVYWATWLDDAYASWAAAHPSPTPAAYRVYQATRQAIAAVTGTALSASPRHWRVQLFILDESGASYPFTVD
ncbi:MAG: ABC transporter substrate-binding protein [Chloroflexota bacterium]|nr:ABC transporter substrate-binding protein [Chloroflexota bacterium]